MRPPWRGRRASVAADTPSDVDMMARVVAGDDEAFACLVGRHEHGLYNYLRRMVQDEALAADLAQETWLRVFRYARRYDATRPFSTWLFTIAHHCCMDALRWRRRLDLHTDTAARHVPSTSCAYPDPREALQDQETLDIVRAAIGALPEPQRAVVLLRHYHGLSYREISEIVQCSLGTVKSRLHHAVRRLRHALRPLEIDDKVPGVRRLHNASPDGE